MEQGDALVVVVLVGVTAKTEMTETTLDQGQMASTDKVLVKKEYFPAATRD